MIKKLRSKLSIVGSVIELPYVKIQKKRNWLTAFFRSTAEAYLELKIIAVREFYKLWSKSMKLTIPHLYSEIKKLSVPIYQLVNQLLSGFKSGA